MLSRLTRVSESTLLAVIVLLAAFLRLYRLDEIPPGLHFDEAFNLFDILRLLQGQFAIFFPANFGREPLYFYVSMVGGALFGDHALTLRLTSAIIGAITVALVYGLTRALFRSPRVAALAALLLAISPWHIYYSRLGLRVILCVPLVVLTIWWFWRAISPSPAKRGRVGVGAFAFAGVCAALSASTYTSGRLLPIILVALTIFAILLDRANWRVYLRGLVVTALVAAMIFLPLGSYFLAHPGDFAEHGSNLSIWDPRVNQGDLVGAFTGNLGAVAGMFFIRGDREIFRNIADRPVFDPFVGALFVISIARALIDLLSPRATRDARLRAFLIGVCLSVLVMPSVLSDNAPNFTRTLPAAPFAMMLPAWAIVTLWERVPARRVVGAASALVLLASATFAFRDYFGVFGASPALYTAFDVDKIDAAKWINAHARAQYIFLAPLWFQQGTLSLYTRYAPLRSFESRDTIVLPSNAAGKDALLAFPLEQEKKASTLASRLGALATREEVSGSNGEKILIVYRVRAENLPDARDPLPALARGGDFIHAQKISRAVWNDALELFGYSVDALDAPQRNLEVTLFFRALKPMTEDYAFSVKARDEKDRVWGQDDKWLGDNSFETTRWNPGDVVIEKFYPGLNPCAPAGAYQSTVEIYNPKTMETLALTDRVGNAFALDPTRAGAAQGNLYEHLEPEQSRDLAVAPNLRLLGFTLTPNELRAGEPFTLALFWRGEGNGATRRVMIRLRDVANRDMLIAEQDVAIPSAGRGVCAFFDARAPGDLAPGMGALFVNDVKVGDIQVVR